MKRLFLLLSLVAARAATAGPMDVQRLNQTLLNSGAGWTARSNPMSALSKEEARLRLGVPMEEDSVEFVVPQTKALGALPPKLDWRDKDGVNWVTPVLDQGNCGSCVAFASVATLETQYKISTGFSGFNIKLSPQNIFACGGGACQFGWFPEAAARFLQRSGVTDEACMPYTSGATGQDVECKLSCADSGRRLVKIASYTKPTQRENNIEALKQALQKGPMVTTLMVYEDFMFYSNGVYKHVTGEALGGHAVSLIGYDDSTRSLIIRNSWAESWGENGFARVSYDDISGIGRETWQYAVAPMSGAVTVEAPVDYSYLAGTQTLKAHSTFPATDSLTISLFDRSGAPVLSLACPSADCSASADLTRLADGRYEVQAIAMNNAGQELGRSSRQLFFVANQKPTLSLSFTGTKGTDLSKPLRDRVEMTVTAKSSTVPMSSVEFHYRGSDGADHSRSARVVVDGLTIGWRTNLLTNGKYEIWMTGRVKTDLQETVVESEKITVQIAN